MALLPKLNICILNNCKKVKLTDITGAYDVSTNPTGWGSPNVDPVDPTAAYITITSPSGIITVVDVLSPVDQIPDPYLGDFDYSIIIIDPEDGNWTFEYTIEQDTFIYTNIMTKFMSCLVRCCIDKVWAKIADGITTSNCGCHGIDKVTEKVLLMEGLYSTMLATEICPTDNSRDDLLIMLQKMCKVENCNCS